MIIPVSFFRQDALVVAPQLLGKYLVRDYLGAIEKYAITEVEVYRGEEDLACHCSKGRTDRTSVMYQSGGYIYVYLIYGIHHLFNIVTGEKDQPQAILLRSIKTIEGPGRITKALRIDQTFNKKLLIPKTGIWFEKNIEPIEYETKPRIGIDYAKEWKDKPWRFILRN